ncbi:glycine cleavage T C-terminal barrel domain-containing protein [Candidatus Pelagibacter sp.]|nr:glycine cleavage T C-terminal barrel domain-containing protein [Candidatus Pelagibacter sp.]
MSNKNFGFGTQIRKSPYFDSTVKWGATGFSVYNHMYIPRDFGSPEQNFWNLIEKAILCDVAVERQVEITGPDAFKFTQLLTPRDLSKLSVGQCKYVLITNNDGGILNDPVLLRLAENHFWLSLADSDILLWAQGVAINSGLNVKISEPDVSPLQLQGPTSGEIMVKLFGEDIKDLKYYWLREYKLDGIPLIVSRTGWSSELGYEIYLRDGSRGNELYEKIMEAGKEHGLQPGHTSTIRRIEGGMLSYHADADIHTNPFELGFDRLVNLDMEANFIGKEALKIIKKNGIKRKQVGLELDCESLQGPNTTFWPIKKDNTQIGQISSAVYSPRLKKNIALGMVDINHSEIGNKFEVTADDKKFNCTIVEKPFYDPKKKIASS